MGVVASAESADGIEETGTSDAGSLSSDQILDNAFAESGTDDAQAHADEDAPTTPETDEGEASEAQASPVEKPKQPEPEKPDPDERYAEQAIPADWKAALAAIKAVDSTVAKQIKAEHYQLAQYKDALPLDEARELRSLFPSKEEAHQARQASADMMALEHSLKTDPRQFIGYIQQRDPRAFERIADEFPKWLYESDPQFYTATISRPAVDINLSHWAKNGSEIEQEAAQVLMEANKRFIEGKSAVDPNEPLRQRLSEYEARERQMVQNSARMFAEDVGRVYSGKLSEQITKAIESAGATGLTRDARKEVVDRVTADINKLVYSDAYTRNYVQFSAKGGPRDAQSHQKLVDYLISKARPMIGQKVREHVTWMTDNIVQASRSRNDKERRVASQKPVTTGAVSGPKQAQPWESIPAAERKRMSPDDIFNRAERGDFG